MVPYDAELECKYSVIVYDGRTTELKQDSELLCVDKKMLFMKFCID